MKKGITILTVIVFSVVLGSLCFAQTKQLGQTGLTGQKSLMKSDQMMSELSGMLNDISGIMWKMAGMMKGSSPDKMKIMSGMIKDLSKNMTEISKIMDKGMASEKTMNSMRNKMMKMFKKISDVEAMK